jgi:hypothetical protein
MKVTFKSNQTLGNRPFKAGTQVVSPHLAGNQAFKRLVKSGQITVHPRDIGEQKVQASKNQLAATKADLARKAEAALQAARGLGLSPPGITELASPGTARKIAAKSKARSGSKG